MQNFSGLSGLGNGIESHFLKQEKKNMEYLSNYPYKYKFIVREVKHKMQDMHYAEYYGLDENFFTVSDIKNKPVYVAKNVTSSKECRYVLMNMEQVGLAVIECKKTILNSKKRSCIIELEKSKYELKTNVVFDKRKFSVSDNADNKLRINVNDTEKEIVVKRNGKLLFQINIIPSDLGGKWGEYVIGCNSESNKLLMVLFGIGIGAMLIESDNLLVID